MGRRFGRHHFAFPWGKPKSVEGSVVVALGAAAAVVIAAALAGAPVSVVAIAVIALVASLAEAAAPRGTDNLFVPVFVWIAAQLVLRGSS